jgi:hypothetical protein
MRANEPRAGRRLLLQWTKPALAAAREVREASRPQFNLTAIEAAIPD